MRLKESKLLLFFFLNLGRFKSFLVEFFFFLVNLERFRFVFKGRVQNREMKDVLVDMGKKKRDQGRS